MSEAELIQAMHEQRASVDLEYTPITAPLPELVRPADVAALRQRVVELEAALNDAQLQITRERNNCAWIGARSEEQAARVAELERGRLSVPVDAIVRERNGCGSEDDAAAIDAWLFALESQP